MILTRDLDIDPSTSESDTQDQHSTPRVEVIAFSIWESEAAIQALAGRDINRMVHPEDQDLLLEPPILIHHQVDSFSVPPSRKPEAA
jgi:heme-degrading monooxygenase HmoA